MERIPILKMGNPILATPSVAVRGRDSGVRAFFNVCRHRAARLVDGGVPLVSQSVLLKGVNDNVETLAALMRAFEESALTSSAVDSNVRRETQFPGSATVSLKIGGIKR